MEGLVSIAGTTLKWVGLGLSPLLLLPLAVLVVPRAVHRPSVTLSALIDRICGFALTTAMVAAFAIIMIQLVAVLLRYVFGLSFSWLNDSIIFGFAMIFMLGAAATLRDDGHVRVDILRPRFSPQARAIIEMIGAMAFIFPIGALILYAGAGSLARSWAGLEPFNESDGLQVKYLFKTLVPVFAVLMMAQGLSMALKAALSLRGLRAFEDATPHHEGQA